VGGPFCCFFCLLWCFAGSLWSLFFGLTFLYSHSSPQREPSIVTLKASHYAKRFYFHEIFSESQLLAHVLVVFQCRNRKLTNTHETAIHHRLHSILFYYFKNNHEKNNIIYNSEDMLGLSIDNLIDKGRLLVFLVAEYLANHGFINGLALACLINKPCWNKCIFH